MSNYPHPIIAREGWPFLARRAGRRAGGQRLRRLRAGRSPLWLIALFMVQFFRDPPRAMPADPKAVLSPADGRIVSVERAEDPYLKRDALKISVFMNVFNAHSNRSPVDGEVRKTWYHPRQVRQRRVVQGIARKRAQRVVDQDAGRRRRHLRAGGGADRAAHPVLCQSTGQTLARGQRYGFIRFGSRVDVYLPLAAVPRASVGDKVYAPRRCSPYCHKRHPCAVSIRVDAHVPLAQMAYH